MKTANDDQDWSNYWQGRAASESGAALVGVGVEKDAEIAAFWDGQFTELKKTSRFLDIACGAGSVILRARECGFEQITGLDYSPDAIAALKNACPQVTGIVASASKTGLNDESFDVIVSQFGFEYAGAEAAAIEIARLMAAGGEFTALSHKTGSAIEVEVTEKRDEVHEILETKFIERARDMFKVSNGSDADFNAAARAFRGPQDALLNLAKSNGGFAAHLYSGTQTLFNKRISYTLDDIQGWLDGMHHEISSYGGRMQSMIDAALSEQEVAAVCAAMEQQGLVVQPPGVFRSGFHQEEISWILKASKPA